MTARLALVSLVGLAASCGDHESIVVVDVNAAADLPAIAHLHATLSNGGLGEEKTFPGKGVADGGVSLPTAFSLTLPASRSGALDIALDALDESGAVVANGDGTVSIDGGGRVGVTIELRPGASRCGNGVVDSGEGCDDGDRISSGTCDFRCQPRPGPTGAGGHGGSSGTTGAAGSSGGGGTAGSSGTSGAAGSSGTSGAAGSSGTSGAAGSSAGGTSGGACTVELLTNGGFDSGETGWTSVTSGRALIYKSADVDPDVGPQPVSPDGLAWLGYDAVSETVLLKQPIQIPAGTQSLTVSGDVQIWSDDDPSVVYDAGYAEILVGAFAQEVDRWSNVDRGTDWTSFSHDIDTTGVSGPATFQLRVQMDDGANTSFFFDSLSVTAHRCP